MDCHIHPPKSASCQRYYGWDKEPADTCWWVTVLDPHPAERHDRVCIPETRAFLLENIWGKRFSFSFQVLGLLSSPSHSQIGPCGVTLHKSRNFGVALQHAVGTFLTTSELSEPAQLPQHKVLHSQRKCLGIFMQVVFDLDRLPRFTEVHILCVNALLHVPRRSFPVWGILTNRN